MKKPNQGVIIVGAGLAGLSCARRLMAAGISFIILEAGRRVGGRIKTDRVEGFLLDHGFQVLQTAYPEARRILDYIRLELKSFAPGAMIRTEDKFHIIADPRRRPQHLWRTATAPIGTIGDRLRIIKLASKVRRTRVSALFQRPDMTLSVTPAKPGIFVCGEYGSVPGIQWAMLSGRHAAEAVIEKLGEETCSAGQNSSAL